VCQLNLTSNGRSFVLAHAALRVSAGRLTHSHSRRGLKGSTEKDAFRGEPARGKARLSEVGYVGEITAWYDWPQRSKDAKMARLGEDRAAGRSPVFGRLGVVCAA
jgi:hypothetical protein